MNWLERASWGITTRLVLIAVIPACLTFLFIAFFLNNTAQHEVVEDVQAQGHLLAASLAQSSTYALVSGNTQQLEQSLARLVTEQRAVQSIKILDKEERVVTAAGSEGPAVIRSEAAVKVELLDAEAFDNQAPHVSLESNPSVSDEGVAVGKVIVMMSAEPILELKRRRLLIATMMIVFAASASAGIGLIMAWRLRQPLSHFVSSLRQIGSGNYDVPVDANLAGELAAIQDVIVAMAQALKSSQQALTDQVEQRTLELQQALHVANEANREKRRLINRVNDAIEEERRRIAIEIHDSFNASVIAMRLWIGTILNHSQEAHTLQVTEKIRAALNDLYEVSRRLTKQMRPEILEMVGLQAALEEMVRTLDEAHPDCGFEFEAEEDVPKCRGPVAMAAYRLTQEALSNVVKHSQATHAWVHLSTHGQQLQIVIKDNGTGFELHGRLQGGIGLSGMKERVSAVKGDMDIQSNSKGTTIMIRIPQYDLASV